MGLLEWLKDKQEFLNSNFAANRKTKSAARSTKMMMDSYQAEYAERLADLDDLEEIGKKIMEEEYERCDKIAALYDKLCEGFYTASLDRGVHKRPPLKVK